MTDFVIVKLHKWTILQSWYETNRCQYYCKYNNLDHQWFFVVALLTVGTLGIKGRALKKHALLLYNIPIKEINTIVPLLGIFTMIPFSSCQWSRAKLLAVEQTSLSSPP